MNADFSIPSEVADFLSEAQHLNNEPLGINILTAEKSRAYSEALRQFTATAELGLVTLDDANDSNPYCYISNGPLAGMVLHYTHDDSPQIAFANLQAFRAALEGIRAQNVAIWDLPEATPKPTSPISGLAAAAVELLTHPDADHAEWLLCLYLPLLPLQTEELLEALSRHDSFFVREALALEIAKRPASNMLGAAERLANDPHPQVARPGERALVAVKRSMYEDRA